MRSYFPGGILNALATTLGGSILLTSSMQRLRRGLRGYLIPFAPHAFVLAVSGSTQKPAYAIGVPNDINAFHYYTVRSSFLFAPLVKKFQMTDSELSSEISHLTFLTTYRYALRPMIPDNA